MAPENSCDKDVMAWITHFCPLVASSVNPFEPYLNTSGQAPFPLLLVDNHWWGGAVFPPGSGHDSQEPQALA
jgi:hypothetical protein